MTRHFVSLSLAFALLATVSLALKERARSLAGGVPQGQVTGLLARAMAARGFAVTIEPHRFQSAVVIGVRGACRLGARDASGGAALDDVFRQQASGIGVLRYLYRGRLHDRLPRIRLFVDRIVPQTLDRVGIRLERPVPVALAASAGCPPDPLGLPDLRLRG